MARKKNLQPPKSIKKYSSKTGRPLLLGKFDLMVQNYIKGMSNRGAVINWSAANVAAKVLIKNHPGVIGVTNVDSSSWVPNLFRRMRFSRRRKTSTKVDIPTAARKDIKYLFLYEIISRVEQYVILDLLIIKFDQTPLKLVQCGNSTRAKKNNSNVTIVGALGKRPITATFTITLSGEFLMMQLVPTQSLQSYQFPVAFSLSMNEKHFSNSKESVKFLNEIIVPYAKKMRKSKGLGKKQMALVIMDVFTGRMTSDVSCSFYRKQHIGN